MQRMQRGMGRLIHRSVNEGDVATLLSEFDGAEKSLGKLIDGMKEWREAWRDVLNQLHLLANEFYTLYKPIIAASNDFTPSHVPVLTPRENVERVANLEKEYASLRNDLLDEIDQIETRIVRPAQDAKASLKLMRKVIKKREDLKLDYERYQGRFDAANRKQGRTEREETALMKHESDLARAAEEYRQADENLKARLPRLVHAIYSLVPELLAQQMMIQNRLLGHCYTSIMEYCQAEGYPCPPPPTAEVITVWKQDFLPLQNELESGFSFFKDAKSTRKPIGEENKHLYAGLGYRNGAGGRRPSGQSVSPARSDTGFPPPVPVHPNAITSPPPIPAHSNALARIPSNDLARMPSNDSTKPFAVRNPSSSSLARTMPNYSTPVSIASTPADFLTPSSNLALVSSRSSGLPYPGESVTDYFSRSRQPSTTSNTSASSRQPSSSPHARATTPLSAIAAAKKKPPPVPVKRIASNQSMYVTALYDYTGDSQGDLTFREGEKIRVVKKTGSSNDWWVGEVVGRGGVVAFQANYVQAQ